MVELTILAGFLLTLAIGGVIADYIFPHIKSLNRWIDSLPQMREADVDYEAIEEPEEEENALAG